MLSALVFLAGFAGTTHEVQPGDTLSDYASRHNTTVAELVRINGIRNPNYIVVGTVLEMPGGASSDSGTPSSTTYRIRPGDTLARIASAHGTTVSALVSANGITNQNLIIAGRTLKVPGSSSSTNSSAPISSGSPGLSGQQHTVKSGETLGGIAARYGISARDLSAWNGITDGRIYATTKLVLYSPGRLPSQGGGSSAAGSHTVTSGETLGMIARRFGTTIAKIAGANSITDQNLIRVGQKLVIPGAGSGGGASIRCPVPGARFFNDWGFPRSGGRSHAGNDLFAARGTPVYAPVSGRVEQLNGSISGRAVRVFDRSGGYWYVAHLNGFGTSGNVAAGDIIGYVGDSGNARGSSPHGHVEYRDNRGVAINPYPILRAAC